MVTEFDARHFDGRAGVPVGSPPAVGGGNTDAGSSPRPDAAAMADAAPTSCNVLLQNCGTGTAGKRLACYLSPSNTGVCEPAGTSEERTPCVDHQQCAPGLLCVETLGPGSAACLAVCDLERNDRCPSGGPCRPLEGVGFGYCAS